MNIDSNSREGSVKKVEVLLNPIMLDSLKQALTEVGIQDVTAAIVKSFRAGNARTEQYRGVEYRIEYLPQVKVEFVVSDEDCPRALVAIHILVKHHGLEDTSVTVIPCQEIFYIRTGEMAVAAA
jgi:nitrogen regulatory protein PII